jgi:hypothetical protein
MLRSAAVASLAAWMLLLPPDGEALTIQYSATDLADAIPGQDLWSYAYTVTGFDFDQDLGFAISFAPGLYEDLESPPPTPNADWDILTLQPDGNLPADGLYDALALVDDASLADPFTVSFVWIGGGAPGSQPFFVYDESFQTVESGFTVLVPEPGTLLLLGAAVPAFCLRRRRPR